MSENQPLFEWERDAVDKMAAEPMADASLHAAWLAAREQGMVALCNYIELTRSLLPPE
jgi:hypothetical protein